MVSLCNWKYTFLFNLKFKNAFIVGFKAYTNLGLQLLWYFLQIIFSAWYFISVVGNLFESYFTFFGVLKKYKSLHSGKVRYLAIVIESEEAYQISKVVKLLQWLDSIGVKECVPLWHKWYEKFWRMKRLVFL